MEENWRKFVKQYGQQLSSRTSVVLDEHTDPLIIDYRFIPSEQPSSRILLYQTGWGSGWEWITESSFFLWFLESCNINILHISLPGTGNSSNPPPWYWQDRDGKGSAIDFCLEAQTIYDVISKLWRDKILPEKFKLIPVGHSMGCQILAKFTKRYPDMIDRLVFLAPSGIEATTGTLNQRLLVTKFVANGSLMKVHYKLNPFLGKTPIHYLQQYFVPPENPFTPYRKPQRWSEFERICQGGLLEVVREIPPVIPILSLWGSRDFVCPYRQHPLLNSAVQGNLQHALINDGYHNLTMQIKSYETALTISNWLHDRPLKFASD